MCIGIIWNLFLVGGRARAEARIDPRPLRTSRSTACTWRPSGLTIGLHGQARLMRTATWSHYTEYGQRSSPRSSSLLYSKTLPSTLLDWWNRDHLATTNFRSVSSTCRCASCNVAVKKSRPTDSNQPTHSIALFFSSATYAVRFTLAHNQDWC